MLILWVCKNKLVKDAIHSETIEDVNCLRIEMRLAQANLCIEYTLHKHSLQVYESFEKFSASVLAITVHQAGKHALSLAYKN